MRQVVRLSFGFLVALLATLGPRGAFAMDQSVVSTARSLAKDGERDFHEGRYVDATQKFQKAYDAIRLPTLARSLARALVNQGKLVAASEAYRQAVHLEPNELWTGNVQQDAQAKSQEELDALLPRLSHLKVTLVGASASDVQLSIDGAAVPTSLVEEEQPRDPGEHHVLARRGNDQVEQSTTLKEGEHSELKLQFAPAKPAVAPTPTEKDAPTSGAATKSPQPERGKVQRNIGWVSLSVGGAGLVVGSITGFIAKSKHSDIADQCPNNTCNPDQVTQAEMSSFNHYRTASMIGFIAGGAFTTLGLTLLLTSPKQEQPSVALWLGPDSTGVKGVF
jgi:hypothetical protein